MVSAIYEAFVQCRSCNKSSIWQVGSVSGQIAPPGLMEKILSSTDFGSSATRPSEFIKVAAPSIHSEASAIFDEGVNVLQSLLERLWRDV